MLTHVDDDGEQRVLLTDFGIARNVDDISGLTTTNMTVGTVAYSAPEQLMGDDIDGRADQYALAATTYHLLTGVQLFPHSNPAVVISRHLNSPPPALADTRPELAALDPVLSVALAKSPNDRFVRRSDFAAALVDHSSDGGLIVYDAIIDDERRANAFGLLMSLNMLIEGPGRIRLHGCRLPRLDGRRGLQRELCRAPGRPGLDGGRDQVSGRGYGGGTSAAKVTVNVAHEITADCSTGSSRWCHS